MSQEQQTPLQSSQQLYDTWYATLDEVDRELYQKVQFTKDDDYPISIIGTLSPAAKERGGYYELEKGYWTVCYVPGPPDSYFEALKREEDAKYAQEKAASKEEYQMHQRERERMYTWTGQLEAQGFVCTSLSMPREALQDGPYQGEEHTFHTGSFGGSNRFWLHTLHGQPVWDESYGNAGHLWMPKSLANQLYQEEWERRCKERGAARHAFHALTRVITDLNCYADDYYTWVRDTIGMKQLLTLAKEEAPLLYEDGWSSDHAFVSKFYRIPVQRKEWLGEQILRGYGETRIWERTSFRSEEGWESHLRKEAWIPLGEEEDPKHHWPTEEDLQERQQPLDHSLFDLF